MTSVYPHDERVKSRSTIKRLDALAARIENMALGRTPFEQNLVAGVTALTDTSDLASQHQALAVMSEARRKQHFDRLTEIAPDDLTAFAECISPHEPPAPHLIYISERLMEIERGDRDRLILSMPPGHAKDLDVDTPVMMGDGSWKRLGDIQAGDMVITHKGRPREVLATHDQGVRPVVEITTDSRRVVRAHEDHVFLTPGGWLPAKDLRNHMALAIPKEYEITGSTDRPIDEFSFMGYLFAGSVVTGRSYSRFQTITNRFRCDDPIILENIKSVAKRLGFTWVQQREIVYSQSVVTLQFGDEVKEWLKARDVWRMAKFEARVPKWVFGASQERISAFLSSVLSCDATFRPKTDTRGENLFLKVSLSIRENPGLAWDMIRLFQVMGIKASMNFRHAPYNQQPTTFFRVDIVDHVDQLLLSRRIPLIGSTRRFWDLPLVSKTFSNPDFHTDEIRSIKPAGECQTRCLTVEEDASFLANGIVVHNSTYGSRYYPSWYLGRKENRLYLQAGHTADFAVKEFGRKTKDIIISDAYRRIFPGVQLRFDAKASGDWALTNGNRYVAKGVGDNISGFRSSNNGIDDPYANFAAAQSPGTRKKVWDWFVNDFMTRLLPQGNAFVIMTRWHLDDIVGRLLEMMESGEIDLPWDFINLPVFCTDEASDQMGRKLDEPLWPDFYTTATLLRQKALMSPPQWCALYEGNPVPMEGNVIKAKWLLLRYRTPPLLRANSLAASLSQIEKEGQEDHVEKNDARDPIESQNSENDSGGKNDDTLAIAAVLTAPSIIGRAPAFTRTVMSVDSAEKDTQRADYSALTIWREGIDRRHYLVDAHRERMEFPRLCACIDEYAALWDVELVLMETKGAGNQYIQHTQALETPKPFVVVPCEPGKDGKIFRMDAQTPFFMANRVILPERAPWLATFERELLQFPGSKNDDFADTVSQYLKFIRDHQHARRGTKKLRM